MVHLFVRDVRPIDGGLFAYYPKVRVGFLICFGDTALKMLNSLLGCISMCLFFEK